jgi:hypothetical protein
MGTMIESKRYPNVVVRIHKDTESGIVITKSYSIIKNDTQVRDNLTVMCLKHDLRCIDCSKSFGEPIIICTLRSFSSVVEMIEYIKNKANKLPYSFKLKGKFALATIGEKKYIYRITLKKEES